MNMKGKTTWKKAISITLVFIFFTFTMVSHAFADLLPINDKVSNLNNLAPTTSFGFTKKKKIDLTVNLNGTQYSPNLVQAKLNSIVYPGLVAEDIQANIELKTGNTKLDNGVYMYNIGEIWRWDPITNEYVQITHTGGNVTGAPYIGANSKIYYTDKASGRIGSYDVNAGTNYIIPNTSNGGLPALDGNIYSVNAAHNLIQTISTSGYQNVIASGVYADQIIGEDRNGQLWYIVGANQPFGGRNTLYAYNENTGKITQMATGVDVTQAYFLNNEGTLVYHQYAFNGSNVVQYVGTHNGAFGYNYGEIKNYNTGIPGIIYLDCDSGSSTTSAACYPQTPNQGGYYMYNLNTQQAVLIPDMYKHYDTYYRSTYKSQPTITTFDYKEIFIDTVWRQYYDPKVGDVINEYTDFLDYTNDQNNFANTRKALSDLPFSISSPFGYIKYAPKQNYITEYSMLTSLSNQNWRNGVQHFFADIGDRHIDELDKGLNVAQILANTLSNNVSFYGLGTSENQTQYEKLISQNNGKGGEFFDNTNLDNAMAKLRDAIIKKVNDDADVGNYILLGDSIDYQTSFTDIENDPLNAVRWLYTHDPSIYENNQGKITNSGVYVSAPINPYDHVGKYDIDYNGQDSPTKDDLFANYRKWSSNASSKTTLYVHRAPIPLFSAIAKKNGSGTYDVSVNEFSYDLDHRFLPNKGIVQKVWKWRNATSTQWTMGLPPSTLPADQNYIVDLAVKDMEGATAELAKPITTTNANLPPVAMFDVNPNRISLNENYTILDHSYDPNGDPLAQYIWTATKNGVQIYTGSTAPNSTTMENNAAATGLQKLGDYVITLKVQDDPPNGQTKLWSDLYSQTVTIFNTPPEAVLTFPSGSQASPSYVSSLMPTITWNQMDIDPGTTFAAYQVLVKDPSGNVVVDSGIQAQAMTSTTASWVVNQNLAMGALYQVTVRVNDGTVWSNWSNIGWLVTNRPPTATMTVPGGTQGTPTIFNSLRPTMQWNQTDPDPGTVFKAFQIWITNEPNNMTILDSGPIAQNTTSTAASWTVNQDLPAGQKLRVMVRTFDGFVWSNYSSQTWMYINRAPTGNFTWTPSTVYEGDTVTISQTVSDPDNDPLNVKYSISGPNGYSKTFNQNLNVPYSASAPSFRVTDIGNYTITQTVSDGIAADVVTSKTMKVYPLKMQGYVNHTDEWEQNRKTYNLRYSSDPESPRGPSVFFAGERFMLVGQTTVTGTGTKATSVTVDAPGIGATTLTEDSNNPGTWYGYLGAENSSTNLETLADGPYGFTFTSSYNNGVSKTDAVTIQILDPWTEFFSLHRRY
jgi:hypothetical protein